jgi:tetratricopeptide (TPR) repeat protein
MTRSAWALVIACAIGALAQRAGAQPWAQGVTDNQKAQAQTRLEQGNALFLAQNYKEALEAYQAAVAAWDHPAIRFNIVRCLIWLDRPVEASDNLQLALKYGAEPLEEGVYTEALSYQKLLANQIGDLEVSCSLEGAKLTLDGQPFMTCPGTQKRRVAPGTHGIVAAKDGFLTKEVQIIVVGGKAEAVEIDLVPLDKAAKVVHRWPTWIPWVVFGSGLAVSGVGALIQFDAVDRMNRYDQRVQRECVVTGCNVSNPSEDEAALANELNGLRESAEFRNKLAIGVITVGAAGAMVGTVMLYMNRGRTVYEEPSKATGPTVRFSPSSDGGIVTLSGRF